MSDLSIYLAVGWGVWFVLWAWAVRNYRRSMSREEALWRMNSSLRSEVKHVRAEWRCAIDDKIRADRGF